MITVRFLKPTDDDLVNIASHLNDVDFGEAEDDSGTDFTGQSLANFLVDASRFYAIAYLDKHLAAAAHGYQLLHPTGSKSLYVDEIDTVVELRRHGVATALMRRIFQYAEEAGCSDAWLVTEHDNEPAKALYLGLKPTETDFGPVYSYKL